MKTIELSYSFGRRRDSAASIGNPLMDLRAVRQHGAISARPRPRTAS